MSAMTLFGQEPMTRCALCGVESPTDAWDVLGAMDNELGFCMFCPECGQEVLQDIHEPPRSRQGEMSSHQAEALAARQIPAPTECPK